MRLEEAQVKPARVDGGGKHKRPGDVLEADERGEDDGEQEEERNVLVAELPEREIEQHSIGHRLPQGDGEPAHIGSEAVQICSEPVAHVEGDDVQ